MMNGAFFCSPCLDGDYVFPKECLCLGAQVPELEGVRAVISLEDLSTTGADDARERVQPGATLAARWACSP